MRVVLMFLLLTVSACAEPGPPQSRDEGMPSAAADTCGAAAFAVLIGQDAAMFPVHKQKGPTRIMRPGQPVTMDFIPDRLNVLLDAADRIVGFRCG